MAKATPHYVKALKKSQEKALPKTFQGKSTKPGGGGRFAMAVEAMHNKGMPMSEAQAIAAMQGRAKYGPAQMAKYAAQGRKRGK